MKLQVKPAIAGKVVIVTGASSGIGESTAREFARAGARVVLTARRAERLKRLQGEIEQAGGIALAVPTDLTQPNQIADLVERTVEEFGRIDILVNIAGYGHYDWFEELSTETLRKPYEVNIIGMGELIRQVLPTMKAQRSGMIINMSSYSSRIAVPPLTVYSSTKGAVDRLSDGLRRELLPWGIQVMRVHPSAVTGTGFKEKAVADGGVRYRTIALGRISRDYVAREIVRLVEHPQRSLYLGRLYDVAVFLEDLLPSFVDWFSSNWVSDKRRKELSKANRRKTKKMDASFLWMPAAILALGFILIRTIMKEKSPR